MAQRVASFLDGATKSLDIAQYDLRLEEAPGTTLLNSFTSAVKRGVVVRLMFNQDHAQTIPVPFNDADALDARLAELSGQVACVIMEPGMMNIGVVLPQEGYLAAVREITKKHGVLLIFDEVKTGITIAAGGAVERFGVTPDIVTLAKALAAGLPSGAIGGSEEVGDPLERLAAAAEMTAAELPPEAQAPVIQVQTADAQFAAMYLGFSERMSITAVPISRVRVRAPIAASSGNGEPSWRAK